MIKTVRVLVVWSVLGLFVGGSAMAAPAVADGSGVVASEGEATLLSRGGAGGAVGSGVRGARGRRFEPTVAPLGGVPSATGRDGDERAQSLSRASAAELFTLWPGADPSLKALILEDLLSRGPEALPTARVRLAGSETREEAFLAVELLTRLCGSDCAGDLLETARAHREDVVRASALQALASAEVPGAAEMAAPFLSKDEPPEVITAALSVIGRTGSPDHAELAGQWLNDPDPGIRLLAHFVVRRLKQNSAGLHPPDEGADERGVVGQRAGSGPFIATRATSLAADFKNECKRVLEEAGGWSLQQHYLDGNKHLVAFSVGYQTVSVQLVFDLDDLLGYTAEGQDDWITYWIDVKVGFGLSVSIFGVPLPGGMSLVNHGRELGVDDPLRRLQFTALSGTIAGIEVKVGDVGFEGSDGFSIGLAAPSTDLISGSALSTSGTALKGEIRRSEIEFVLGGALAAESGGISWSRLAEAIFLDLVRPVGFFHHFDSLNAPEVHRPFTSSDNPPAPGTGNPRALTISEVRAGLDADGDGFADGYVPPSGSGTNPTTLWDLDVFFFSDNAAQDDFRVRVVDVPNGWTIAARGANDEVFGDVYDVFDAVPNSLYGTEWYIGCAPGAPQTVGVDFELVERRFLLIDPVLDRVTAALTCSSPPPPPSSSTQHTLTVEKIGGSLDGTITSSPSIVTCGTDCSRASGTAASGTEVTLTASPSAGTVFAGWGGDCSGTGTCVVALTESKLVAASFNPELVTISAPSVPSNLQAVARSTSTIDLSWSDTSGDEDGFKIQRRDGADGDWFQIKTLGSGTTSFTNVSLVPGTTYEYRVYAYNAGGDSGYSGKASATTFSAAPNAPTNVRGWALSTTKIALSWDDPNAGTAAYEIEASADGSSWSVVGYNGTGDTTFTRTVNPESTRFFRVRAYRSGSGYSGYSSPIAVTACAAPSDPRLEDPYSGEDEVPVDRLLEWDGNDEVSSWDLYLGTSEDPPPFAQGIGNPSPGDNVIYDPGDFSPGQTYYWKVVAHAACDPALTSSSRVEFFSILGAPDPVQLLKPADASTDQPTALVLDWANVSSDGSTVYDLYLGTSSPPQFFEFMHTRTEKLVEGLSPETTYYWQVVAKAADDTSLTSSSPVWSFTTGGGTVPPTVHFKAIQDAGLRGGAFANKNYGGDPNGAAEQKAFGTGNDDSFYLDPGNAALRGAVEFDLSSIPSGSNVINATLTLNWAGGSGSHPDPLGMFFVPYGGSWNEGSITWNNRPTRDTANQVQGTFPLSGFNPTQNDLTLLVQKWVDGSVANHGFEISIPEWESTAYHAKYFYQKEWSSSLAADLQVTYAEPCTAPPAPSSPSPAAGAAGQVSPLTLDWVDSSGASSYDVYFGESANPSFHALRATSDVQVGNLKPATTYHWRVEARAACDSSLTSTSPTWSFTTDSCLDLATPMPTSPSHQATGRPRTVTLAWEPVNGAGDYEVYLGTVNPPVTLLTTTASTSTAATLQPGTTYFWRVRGIASCDSSRTAMSAVQVFDTAQAPQADGGPDLVVTEGTSSSIGGSPSASGGVGPYTYHWSVSPASGVALSSATEANPTLTANVPGSYQAQLVVTDSNDFTSLPAQVLIEVPCANQSVVLSGETIIGATLFEACQTLTIGSSVVQSSGELTLRAGQTVSLGTGFRVEEGGSLRIEVDPGLKP